MRLDHGGRLSENHRMPHAASDVASPGDIVLAPGRGIPRGLRIPASELMERFSRSSGPGGQSVNTTDSRVELRFDVGASAALDEQQRERVLAALAGRLVDGVISITSSQERSQLQNRAVARRRLANYLHEALAPPPPARRATRPSRAAR
ncbi:MAG: ribosome-associated protein, partial [Pseudonocardiales bacterium]|nr:ribosome-associated protein [Pseudonocardiales bacterium]